MKNIEEAITEGNKLIVEFMGYKPTNGFEGDDRYTINRWFDPRHRFLSPKRMMYHISWEWLMPVVEKINQIQDDFSFKTHGYNSFTVVIEEKETHVDAAYTEIKHGYKESVLTHLITSADKTIKKNTYNAVVDFIRWYNENKKES